MTTTIHIDFGSISIWSQCDFKQIFYCRSHIFDGFNWIKRNSGRIKLILLFSIRLSAVQKRIKEFLVVRPHKVYTTFKAMKAFQLIRKNFGALGLIPDRGNQAYSFDGKILICIFLSSLSVICFLAYVFFYAKTFMEYAETGYISTAVITLGLSFSSAVFNRKKIRNLINNVEESIYGESKMMRFVFATRSFPSQIFFLSLCWRWSSDCRWVRGYHSTCEQDHWNIRFGLCENQSNMLRGPQSHFLLFCVLHHRFGEWRFWAGLPNVVHYLSIIFLFL